MHGGFSLGQINVLTFSGATTMIQRGKHGGRVKPRRNIVGVCTKRACRFAIFPTCDGVEPRHCCGEVAVSSEHSQWASLSHETSAEHDQVGIDLAQGVVIQTKGLHRAGRERLGDHIRPCDKIPNNRLTFLCGEVQSQHTLARVCGMKNRRFFW